MKLTQLSIKYPAAILVISVMILVFGILAAMKLPLQLVPDIQQPQISISTGWRAAAPEELEAVIIEPIENVVKNTQGVTNVTTNIYREFGSINLTFDVNADMQKAMLDVLNNLNQAPPLPLDAYEPVVSAGGGGNGPPTASFMIKTLPGNDETDLGHYQQLFDDVLKPRFMRIPGMGQVNMGSERPRELRITFDPHKAASLGLTLDEISSKIAAAKNSSAGIASVGRRQYTVRFSGQLDVDNFENMIIGYHGQRSIFLKDIATVENRLVDRFAFSLRSGQPAYFFSVFRQNGANTVELLDEINQALKELNEGPMKQAGLVIDLSFDASLHIRNALELVQSNLGLGVFLALGILWLFLRGIKVTLIIACTIPFSIALAFVALNLFDRTLNVISLAGLAFSVGLVLDAAIVVQENIVRLRSQGMDRKKAVIAGTLQVTGALFASTVTSVAIFLPILTVEGIEGQLFSDLALTLSIAVMASFVSAITVLPLASKYLLSDDMRPDPYSGYWHALTRMVMKATDTARRRYLLITLLLGGSAIVSLTMMPKTDFMPRAPIDGFYMSFDLPAGGNIDFIEQDIASLVKTRLSPYLSGDKLPKIKSYNFYSIGAGNTGGFIYADDPKRVEELMDALRKDAFSDFPDTQVYLQRGSMLNISGGGNGRSVDIDLKGADIQGLVSGAQAGLGAVSQHIEGATAFPMPSLSFNEPELNLVPDDKRITQAGLNRNDVARALSAFTSGLFIGEYFDGNDRVNMILRSQRWGSPEELASQPLVTPRAGVQQLGELADVQRTVGPNHLRRIDGKRTITVRVIPPADMSLEVAIETLQAEVIPAMEQALPDNASIQLNGNANRMASAITDMVTNFLLALLILFLLMAALFKSATDSLLVLLIMPLAIAGGVLSLNLLNVFTFQSLDLLTMIGFVILLGLVVNNAILIVDQTRQGEKLGKTRKEAVQEAVLSRARPVYLSTLTSLFGMLPLMVMPGVGSEIYRGLATVIVGGMGISTLFTLLLFPCLLRLGESRATKQAVNKQPVVTPPLQSATTSK